MLNAHYQHLAINTMLLQICTDAQAPAAPASVAGSVAEAITPQSLYLIVLQCTRVTSECVIQVEILKIKSLAHASCACWIWPMYSLAALQMYAMYQFTANII